MGLVYDPRELLGIMTTRPGVAGVLQHSKWQVNYDIEKFIGHKET
jgi:hypothetical protein